MWNITNEIQGGVDDPLVVDEINVNTITGLDSSAPDFPNGIVLSGSPDALTTYERGTFFVTSLTGATWGGGPGLVKTEAIGRQVIISHIGIPNGTVVGNPSIISYDQTPSDSIYYPDFTRQAMCQAKIAGVYRNIVWQYTDTGQIQFLLDFEGNETWIPGQAFSIMFASGTFPK